MHVEHIVTILVTTDGFGSVTGFIELLQLVNTSKDYALTVLHISQITTGHTTSSQSVSLLYTQLLQSLMQLLVHQFLH
jgi:hypothetical protein